MTSYVAQLRSGRTATEFLLSEVGKNDLKRNLIGIRKTTFRSTKSHSKKKEREQRPERYYGKLAPLHNIYRGKLRCKTLEY